MIKHVVIDWREQRVLGMRQVSRYQCRFLNERSPTMFLRGPRGAGHENAVFLL